MSTGTTAQPFPDVDGDIRRAPYMDVCSQDRDPNPKIPNPVYYRKQSKVDGFTLAFGVVLASDPTDVILKWGGHATLWDGVKDVKANLAHGEWEKDNLQEFTNEGGKFVISFGGQVNYPLEKHWKAIDPDLKHIDKITSVIASQYEDIINNYTFENYERAYFDFDFEGSDVLGDYDTLAVHVAAMAVLLDKQSPPKTPLKIGYTLPVGVDGFNEGGKYLLKQLANKGIQPSWITGMLMEFGGITPMWECCKSALSGMHGQIKEIFKWDDDKVWRHIGACPMFGVNNNGKKFTLEDMQSLVEYARGNNIGCLSGWSANHDACGQPCTEVPQNPFDFCRKIATYQPQDI